MCGKIQHFYDSLEERTFARIELLRGLAEQVYDNCGKHEDMAAENAALAKEMNAVRDALLRDLSDCIDGWTK